MERVVLPALLAWAVFTNLLMFLPAPRNLPVAICRTSGSDGKTTTFYTLEFALRARRVEREIHGKAEHNRESDTLVVVSSIVRDAIFVVFLHNGPLLIKNSRPSFPSLPVSSWPWRSSSST